MVREWAISIYLVIFSVLFNISKLFPLKRKVTFVVSFSENSKSIYKEMLRQEFSCRTLFLTTEKMYPHFKKFENSTTLLFNIKKPIHFVLSIYHLATSKVILVDNYYGFLAKSNFKPTVECIQLWHANGAIKKFGLKDPSTKSRKEKAIKRFKDVYRRFSKVVIGSEAMAYIYKQAFEVSDEKLVRTGIPRTDVFFDKAVQHGIRRKLLNKHPIFKNKKVILYAPTYRENGLQKSEVELELNKLADHFNEDYILLLKLHPAIDNHIVIPEHLSDFILDFSSYHSLNELLFITDILVTDYSSIPFEFCLLNKPIIFYLYDLEEYKKERGIWQDFIEFLPGPVANTSEEVISFIKGGFFNYADIQLFSNKWNEYSTGNSSANVLNLIKHSLDK
ncbi:teichoic acid biosynthesis protein B [Bacillus sp. MKU004]|nr:teichoic acid biosynthesis protein B [Bacillus sp. MKU004]